MNLLKKVIFVICFLFFSWGAFGQLSGAFSYGYGRIIPTHRVYPEIENNSNYFSAAVIWQSTGRNFRWAKHYNYPLLMLSLNYNRLGNPDVLGNAFGVLPSMSFYLKKGKNAGWRFDIGSGVAFLSKPYHAVKNPENNVYGSKFNFFFELGVAYEIAFKKHFALAIFLKLPHYSASNLHQPNLGINTFNFGTSIRYLKHQEISSFNENKLELPVLNKKIKPFFRLSFGLTRNGLNGPKYPVYVAGFGFSKLLNRYSRINSGFEYIFNTAKYNFIRHTYAFTGKEFEKASRYSWYLGYEWLFGHVGFLAEAGLYLNNHYGRQSIFTTKLGFNLYPWNTILHSNFLPYFGAYVRAYAGEADFFEMSLGFNF